MSLHDDIAKLRHLLDERVTLEQGRTLVVNRGIYHRLYEQRCVEPRQRMVGGRWGWAVHRFPIRGGLTIGETLLEQFGANVNRDYPQPWTSSLTSAFGP